MNLNSVCLSLTVTIQKANVWSPWTPCFFFFAIHSVYWTLLQIYSTCFSLIILKMSSWNRNSGFYSFYFLNSHFHIRFGVMLQFSLLASLNIHRNWKAMTIAERRFSYTALFHLFKKYQSKFLFLPSRHTTLFQRL